jgi:very-short-patch-repair endonuclease
MASAWANRLVLLDRWLVAHDDLVTVAECELLGFGPDARRRLGREGHLTRAQRGVFVRGRGPVTPAAGLRAAVRAAGQGAAASQLSAAWWWGLVAEPPQRPHVTVPSWRRVRLPGVVVHQADAVSELRTVRGLAVTTPERTIVDLAGRPDLSPSRLEALVEGALGDHLTTVPRLAEATTGRRRLGGRRLRRLLEEGGLLGAPGASVLELRAQRLVAELARTHGIELPAVEHRQLDGRYRIDLAWPRLRLAVEVDGFAWHRSSSDLDHEAERRTDLVLAGWEVIAFTWKQVVREPEVFCEKVLAAYRRVEARAA